MVRAFWNALTIEHCTKPTCDHSHILYIQFLSENIVSVVTRAVVLVKRLLVEKARENNRSIMISHVEYSVSASALVL
jgi:hypothetical protein